MEFIHMEWEGRQRLAEIIRGIDDDALDRTVPMPAMGGQEVSAQQLAEMILIGHITQHQGSIRSATGT